MILRVRCCPICNKPYSEFNGYGVCCLNLLADRVPVYRFRLRNSQKLLPLLFARFGLCVTREEMVECLWPNPDDEPFWTHTVARVVVHDLRVGLEGCGLSIDVWPSVGVFLHFGEETFRRKNRANKFRTGKVKRTGGEKAAA